MGPGKLVFLEVKWISSQVNSARSIRKRGTNVSNVPGRVKHRPLMLASIARQGRRVSTAIFKWKDPSLLPFLLDYLL